MVLRNLVKLLMVATILISQASKLYANDNMEKLFIGIMGAALGSAAQKNANQKKATTQAPIIQNNLIRRAQIAFQALGFYTSTIDGKLGSNTMAAAQLYVDKYKQQSFSFAKNQDILILESVAKNFVKIVPEPQTNSEFFGFNKVALAIGSYRSLGEVGLGITEFYQKNRLALSDVQFSIFSTNKGHYITTLGVGDLEKCKRIKSLGVRRKAIPRDSICTVGDGFKEAFVFKDGEIRPSKNWYALNLISVGVPPLNYGDSNENQLATENLLARQTIEKEAKIVLTQLKNFVGDAGRFKKPVEISKLVASLEKEIKTKDLQKITLNYNKLKDLLKSEDLFITYQDRIAFAEAEAKKKAVNRAIISLEKYKAFITNFVSEKPFDKKSTVLIGMGEEIDTALLENDLDKLIDVFDGIAKKLSALALYSDAQNFKITKTEDVEKIQAEALATEALLAEATEIINAIESYMEEGQKFVDVRGISRGFVKLKQAVESKENLAVVIANIKKVYETDGAFEEFLGREKRAKEVAEAEALKEANDRVLKLTGFIAEIVEENPLLPNIEMLWEADDKAKDLLARGDTALILEFYSKAMETLNQMSLKKDYDSYLAKVELESKSDAVAETQAKARMKQLSISSLRKQGDRLIEDIEKFERENEFSLAIKLKLARLMSSYDLVPKNDEEEEEKLSEAIRLLRLAIKDDTAFQDFRVREIGFRAAKESDSLALASDEAKYLINFIETEISKNLSNKVLRTALIEILDLVKNAVTESNSKTLLIAIDEGKRSLENLKLDLLKKFSFYKDSIGVNNQLKAVITATNGLAITALNADILSGDKRDIIALENKTGGAPNILRDLLGTIVFSDNRASICWAGKPSKIGLAEGTVINSLKGMGASKIKSIESCAKDKFGDVDIILIHRGTFLTQNIDYASKILQWFEKDDLIIIDTWFWEDFEEKMVADKIRSDKNLRDLNGGVLDGYGFLKLDNSSNNLCTVVENSADENIHNVYLNAKINELELWASQIETRKNMTKEKAFARTQKGVCSIIYASAKDLKSLISGLNEQEIPFEFSSFWANQETLSIIENKLRQEKNIEERDLAKLRQEIEAEETLRKELFKKAATEANKKQMKLRSEYSQEANGALTRIRYFLDAGFRPGEFVYKRSSEKLFEAELSFNRTFTKTARWWRIKESSLWELSDYSFEVFDYGTADWQGRRLETVTGELNLKVMNPALGRRDKKCFLLSVMIDDEFNFLRDSNEISCSNKKMISSWQKARNFESRWVVN